MTWRVVASLDTALLTWLFSGNIVTGLKVGGMEIVTKLIIYFLHERAWRVGWKQSDKFHHSKRRSLYKAMTYRFIGTLDTFILAWIFTGDDIDWGYVAIAEVFTKYSFIMSTKEYGTNKKLEIENIFLGLGSNQGDRVKFKEFNKTFKFESW